MQETESPVRIEVYSKPGCHLCDEAEDAIERVRQRYNFDVKVVNIETDPELLSAYGTEIPVVFINGNKAYKYRVDEADLERKVKRLWKA
jgi:glutaredoxin